MKEEMKKYFDQLIEAWQGFNNSYPKVPWNDAVTSTMYEGEVDQDEYICWKPIEKKVIHDFRDIEQVLGVTLHNSIKDYFNSYWFAELAGFYKSYNIVLEPVLPGIELSNFVAQLMGYKEVHEGKLDNILLGVEDRNSFLVVIEDAIANTKALSGNTEGTFVHENANVKVIVNQSGKVVTVIPR